MLDNASGELRLDIARKLELLKAGTWNFLWVVDFPMFDYDEKEKRFAAMHHPFTSPREEDMEKLESDPGAVKARAYDLVLNGSEIGGGSIRIHRQDIQRQVFKVLGLSEEKARERFGFFLDALEYGTPPHGGIALGHDRINALMAGEASIREVIAFPKTASAVDMMCESPAAVDLEQLAELGIDIVPNPVAFKCECNTRVRTISATFSRGFGLAPSISCPKCGKDYPGQALTKPWAVQYFDTDLQAWITDPKQVTK
jgi:aspartyl-tRNA synthetase